MKQKIKKRKIIKNLLEKIPYNMISLDPYKLNTIDPRSKKVIEKEAKADHFILNVGSYTFDANGNLIGSIYPDLGPQNFNTRAYTPNRVVLVGTDPGNQKSAKLILTYGKK